ncbi:hypothetical protein KR009_007797, partial [Drosophila setifemur]
KALIPRVPWYVAGGFVLFWVTIFLGVVVPLFNRLPEPKTLEDAGKGVFISERAQENLRVFDQIGVKTLGSANNEIQTLNFLLNELGKIQANANPDYVTMEIDHQIANGTYDRNSLYYVFQNIQNVIVRVAPKDRATGACVLINTHFDSKPTSHSASDAGHMVVVLLEVIRIITTQDLGLENTLIFLFNGAEENTLQGSHAFLQHEWYLCVAVVINLDSAGSGGKELLFQSGPKKVWLLNVYKKSIKHPFATTVGEEIFQTGIVPSDTDMKIFLLGERIGYDFGMCKNGYVYHTKFDRYDIIPRASLQNTGDNILSLVIAVANAPELTETTAEESAVFFDVLGVFFITYSASFGTTLNYAVAAVTIVLVYVSLLRIAAVSKVTSEQVLNWFVLILVVQLVAFVLGLGLPIVVGYMFDKYGLTLSYFSTPAISLGLYVCPSLVGLALPSYIYLKLQKNENVTYAHQLQMALHAHAVILSVLCAGINYYGLRSTYIFTWTLIFYAIPLALNLLTTLQDRGWSWTGVLKIIQIAPFMYNSYLFYTLVVILTPMMGRFGQNTNPDLIISALVALGTILSMGFLILLVHMSRRSGIVLVALLAVSAATIYIASSTQIGFPYRPKTNVQRVNYLVTRRIFYEYDGTVIRDESGYVMSMQDRRGSAPFVEAGVNLKGMVSVGSDCSAYPGCGVPISDWRYWNSRLNLTWVPRTTQLVTIDQKPIEILKKTVLEGGTTVRFDLKLYLTNHATVMVQPYPGATLTNWTLPSEYLATGSPYIVFYSYGVNPTDPTLSLEITKSNGDFDVPVLILAVARQHMEMQRDQESQEFYDSFPNFAAPVEWPADHHQYIL